jgi:hypothetical protein
MVVFFYVFIIAENMLIGITKRDKDEEWISDTVLEEYECHRIVFVSTATAMLDKLREPWKDKTIFEKVMRYPWLPPVSGDYPNSQADVVTFRLSTKETCNPDENNLPLEIPPLGLCYFSTDERESNNAKKVPCVQVSVDGGPVHRINAVWHAIFVAWFRIRSVSGVPGEQELLPWEDQKSVGDVCLFPFALDMFEAMVFSIFFFFFFPFLQANFWLRHQVFRFVRTLFFPGDSVLCLFRVDGTHNELPPFIVERMRLAFGKLYE